MESVYQKSQRNSNRNSFKIWRIKKDFQNIALSDPNVVDPERADIRIEQYDQETVRSFVEDFLVHLDKLWMQIELPHKQALQSEIFPDGLVAENKKIRIASLASTFKLIHALGDDNVDLVTPRKFESCGHRVPRMEHLPSLFW